MTDNTQRLIDAEAVIDGLKCRDCGGKGSYTSSCSLCGDSTYDHLYCTDETRVCKECEGTGKPKVAQEYRAKYPETAERPDTQADRSDGGGE